MSKHRVEISNLNTSEIKVLTNDEMINLFKKYKEGNILAKEELINGNLKLVLSILRKYVNRTDNLDDLFQIGCIGLIKAIDNFDLCHEVIFSTYAVPMILGDIKRYLRDNSTIRITRSVKDMAYRTLKGKEELINKLNREPTNTEIAHYISVSELEVNNALEACRETLSMSDPIYSDSGDTIYLSDQIASKETLSNDMRLMLKEALNLLKEKEKYIIFKRYFEGKTQMELSEELGISQAQISRIEKTSLDVMRKIL